MGAPPLALAARWGRRGRPRGGRGGRGGQGGVWAATGAKQLAGNLPRPGPPSCQLPGGGEARARGEAGRGDGRWGPSPRCKRTPHGRQKGRRGGPLSRPRWAFVGRGRTDQVVRGAVRAGDRWQRRGVGAGATHLVPPPPASVPTQPHPPPPSASPPAADRDRKLGESWEGNTSSGNMEDVGGGSVAGGRGGPRGTKRWPLRGAAVWVESVGQVWPPRLSPQPGIG